MAVKNIFQVLFDQKTFFNSDILLALSNVSKVKFSDLKLHIFSFPFINGVVLFKMTAELHQKVFFFFFFSITSKVEALR